MEIQSLGTLLYQIKTFLSNNKYIQGAFNLLARLDAYLDKKSNLKMADYQQQQIILDSQDQLPRIQPRQFANIIDIFALDFNFQTNSYQIIPFIAQHNPETKNDQHAIFQLFLSSNKQHCIQKQKTNSMTQLHLLTSNVSKSLPCLILPNYSNETTKYIYVYETKQCIQQKNKYYLVDRYYCFVMDGLANEGLQFLFRQFRNRVFQSRITKAQDPFEVNWRNVRESFKYILGSLVDRANQTPLKLNYPSHHIWTQNQVQYFMPTLKTQLISSLTLLITFLALNEYKIILLTSKQEKHRLSDIMLSVQGSLLPLKYVYPIVFCTLNKNHCDFIESPVPLTIGFWGSQKRRSKLTTQLLQLMHQIKKDKATPTIVINIQTNQVICESQIKNEDIYIIEKMNKFINKYGKGAYLWQKISCFIQEMIEQLQYQQKYKKQQNQWVALLQAKIKNSQMYNLYTET